MNYKIFVSYSTHDIAQVELLRQQLKGTPIEVFVAEHSVKPSDNLSKTISNAIVACDLFVVLWSKNAQDSDWVSQEIGRAGALHKTILPLVLTKGISLPGFISDLKYLPIHSDPEKAVTEVRKLILNSYNAKVLANEEVQKQKQKQKDKEVLALMGIGAFVLWAFSK